MAIDSLRFNLLDYKDNKKELNLMPVDIPVNSVFSTMKENCEFISYLSEDFVMRVLFSRNEFMEKGIDPDPK